MDVVDGGRLKSPTRRPDRANGEANQSVDVEEEEDGNVSLDQSTTLTKRNKNGPVDSDKELCVEAKDGPQM